MSDYNVINTKVGADIVEAKTKQTVATHFNRGDAHKMAKDLNAGAGFAGSTPAFLLVPDTPRFGYKNLTTAVPITEDK